MERNEVSNNENILVKVDQNNLIYIDPNSVIDKDGNILPRGTYPENFVMYANLEADIVPRSTFSATNDVNTLVSIAKGNLNFLRNQQGGDFDTSWTDPYTNNLQNEGNQLQFNNNTAINEDFKSYDSTGQSFGIDSINISIKGANSIPQVSINFIDVRGKTLFEEPQNSPYSAFFHIPWPIFYLTLKGYYGKAIRYRLHLIKFSSKFNESSGNFDISTTFVGSTFAYLSDISLKAIYNSPYMFLVETSVDAESNENTENRVIKISKSSRGIAILNSVYDEYKKKGLIPANFPNITLRELIVKAQSLDKILEKKILNETLHPDIFVGIQDFENSVNDFLNQSIAWSRKYLSNVPLTNKEIINGVEVNLYGFKNPITGTTNELIVGNFEGRLEFIINKNNEKIKNSKLFTDELIKAASQGKTGGGKFTKDKLLAKVTDNVTKYYSTIDGKFYVKIDLLIEDINEIKNVFEQEREKLEKNIEDQMNDIVKNDSKDGLGFSPTIRNIFAVILANADVYIKLMQEVHRKAFQKGDERKEKLKGLSKETRGDGAIYPWPEVKKNADNNKSRVIAYPGEKELIKKLNSDDFNLWPEVEFIEDFIEVSTNKVDPNTSKENNINKVTFIYPNDENTNNTNIISTFEYVNNINPYINSEPASVFYEIYERANYFTLIDSFSDNIIKDIVEKEYENISQSFKEENTIITFLRDKFTSIESMNSMLQSFSPFERYSYYNDQLPTVNYIKNNFESSFQLTQFKDKTNKINNQAYDKINTELKNYKVENYRKSIYPFNSETYLNYLRKTEFDEEDLKFNGLLTVEPSEAFIISPKSSISYVKQFYNKNLFVNKLTIDKTSTNILNTPYFHNQLLYDFNKDKINGKYSGAAYLLLTSLPFYDLDDKIQFNDSSLTIRMSSLFREVGATHFVPYHLICKWGAIYHRYKKYILDQEDILEGCLNVNNLTKQIDLSNFINNNKTGDIFTKYTVNDKTIDFSLSKDVGVHPFYDAIYHQIVNDYGHYNILSGDTSFKENVDKKGIRLKSNLGLNNLNYWTSFTDNSVYQNTDLRFTLLPSVGYNKYINKNTNSGSETNSNETYPFAAQSYFRTIWDDDYINNEYDNKKFPNNDEYFKSNLDSSFNKYTISDNYKKALDLIATFSPSILEEFENIFLRFSSERINDNSDAYFPSIKYTNFQSLLKEIVSVPKESDDDSKPIETLITNLRARQQTKFQTITANITSNDNSIKLTIANPKELNYNLLHGFADYDNLNTFSYNEFNIGQITEDNIKSIKLYLGEDIDAYYVNFFVVNNVELNETNILQFRPIIQIYAGYVKDGKPDDSVSFKKYLIDEIITPAIKRKELYLNNLLPKFAKLENVAEQTSNTKFVSGYETDRVKVELYNYFKSFNDKWIAGNSIGQRLLLEEFLFLDKANKDIGNSYYLNLDRIIELGKQNFDKTNLYSIISVLIKDSGIDMRPLPAYINFYGTNLNNKIKPTPSKKVATNLFGTFLEVDYQESSPKIILQFVGPTSKHLDVTNKKYKFYDDSFYIGSSNNNPLIITPDVFSNVDLSKSNRVVAFEVSIGDQHQGIFKSVQLDQTTLKNTTESFVVLENLARSESGAGAYNVDIGLFDYYRQASYTCDVTCMGNVMIQPTMYFYLKNVPMFRGSYWITEVTHSIKPNNFTTTFKGTRIPYASLPDPKDSFVSSYRTLFDRLRRNTLKKQSTIESGKISTTYTIKNHEDGKSYTTDIGYNTQGEAFENIVVNKSGYYKNFVIPYNGYDDKKFIQLVKFEYTGISDVEWLRARVYEFGNDTVFPVNDSTNMDLISLTKTYSWSDIKNTNREELFYSIDCGGKVDKEKLRAAKTTFLNPVDKQIVSVQSSLTGSDSTLKVNGPVYSTTASSFGVGLSNKLMKTLGLENGDVVYFIIQ